MSFHQSVEEVRDGMVAVTRTFWDRSITVKLTDSLGFTIGEIDGIITSEETPGYLLDTLLFGVN